MLGAWNINVGGRVYGPYSPDRMRAFAGEGRLGPHSLVTKAGVDEWREAVTEPEFASLFEAMDGANGDGASAADGPTESPAAPNGALQADLTKNGNFAIIVDRKSRSSGNFEQAILALGPSYKLLPNVWIVSTEQTVNVVRNRLVQELGKLDSLFVIDATRGKAAWFNFGPDADVRVRRIWQK